MTAEALGGFGDNNGAHFALSHTKAQFKFPLLTKAPRTVQRTFTFEMIHMNIYMTKFILQNNTSSCEKYQVFVFKPRTKCYLCVKLR